MKWNHCYSHPENQDKQIKYFFINYLKEKQFKQAKTLFKSILYNQVKQ